MWMRLTSSGPRPCSPLAEKPWSSVVVGSFFNRLKRERIRRRTHKTRDEARRGVFGLWQLTILIAGSRAALRPACVPFGAIPSGGNVIPAGNTAAFQTRANWGARGVIST